MNVYKFGNEHELEQHSSLNYTHMSVMSSTTRSLLGHPSDPTPRHGRQAEFFSAH